VSTIVISGSNELLEARIAGRRVGVQRVHAPSQGAGLVFEPDVLVHAAAAEVQRELLSAAIHRGRASGCRFLQWIVPCSAAAPRELFRDAGFVRLCTATRLTLSLPGTPLAEVDWPGGLRLASCNPDQDSIQLEGVVAAINTQSLDAPELQQLWSPSDVLMHHRRACSGRDSRWRLLLDEDVAIGVAAACRTEQPAAWDVLTWGIVPSHRGQRLGTRLLAALAQCIQAAGGTRLQAAADSRNLFAIGCYEMCGFATEDPVEVWVHSLGREW
jgi:L-amino acid N-acyltransferase YncA